jgi:2-methylcitrate dehydratase PrpD
MTTEEKLLDFVCGTRLDDIPAPVLETVKHMLLIIAGTTLAGAAEDGCRDAVQFYRALGGRAEATILVYGGKIPAHDAAFVNAAMARALDLCDSIAPGPHIGAALVPACLAAAELAGGLKGRDLLAGLTVGMEVAARMNLTEEAYDGFDPTGICVIFGVAAAVSRILGLNREQTWNALALAFNRCGGSFQSHIDGSLGVRIVQGWVSQGAVLCARLAAMGITGPKNFIDGLYGYLHLYGKDLIKGENIIAGLSESYRLQNMVYKKYPSCALTQGPTDVILKLMAEEGLRAEDVEHIEITVPPYTHKLVGHEFQMGDNPRVNAQFSIRFCVANALVRGSSRLEHFTEERMTEGGILELARRINVVPDEALEARGHTPHDMRVTTRDGREFIRLTDIAPGFPGNPLSRQDHEKRFRDCLDFAKEPLGEEQAQEITTLIGDLENVDDARKFTQLLVLQ